MIEPVLTVSTSEIRTIQQCPARYRFEYVLDRRPHTTAAELIWGSALHRGTESLFSCAQKGLDWTPQAVQGAIAYALAPGEGHEPPADPYARAALAAILRAYAEVWWTDPSTYEVVAVELPFLLPVRTKRGALVKGRACDRCGGDGMPNDQPCAPCHCGGTGKLRPMREGRIDLVVRERTAGECHGCPPGEEHNKGPLLLIEHKSTSWAPTDERYYAGIEVDLQTALYFDAAREMGLNPQGVIYDVVRRPAWDQPKPPPKLKANGEARAQKAEVQYSNPRFGESPADYEERIYRLATAEETRTAWFGRRMLTISEEQIRRARETTHGAVWEIQARARSGHYPQLGDRHVCARTYQVCPWLDVCTGRVEEGGAEFERLYPLKVRKEGR